MNYAQVFAAYEKQLEAIGEEPESLSYTFRQLKKLTLTDFVLLLSQPLSADDQLLVEEIYQQLARHIPAQYILGQTTFCDLTFSVDERVLIPRPETEELVEMILAENHDSERRVLDIGTGSGAIAVSLAHARPDWQVVALDISEDALEVARHNAKQNHVVVSFFQSDVFEAVTGKVDILVSNPPYISEKDKEEVGLNVLTSEPHLALFAEEDGLAIYRKIAEQARNYLTEKGKIYLEIGYKQGEAVADLFRTAFPEKRIRVIKDSFGKDRKVVVDNG